MLDQGRPALSLSEHTTQMYGTGLSVKFDTGGLGKVLAGGELAQDDIVSTSLGTHVQAREAVFTEWHMPALLGVHSETGLRADNSVWGLQFSPSLGLSAWPAQELKVRGALGRAFRSPSFTELYYKDPVNFGNDTLSPEQAVCAEAGADWIPLEGWKFSGT